jgi:hypothetical protein
MSQITHPVLDFFLLGFIAACSLVAGLFFFKFWRATRDPLFLAFLVFLVVEGCTNAAILRLARPNEGSLIIFAFRLFAVCIVLAAIVRKNTAKS